MAWVTRMVFGRKRFACLFLVALSLLAGCKGIGTPAAAAGQAVRPTPTATECGCTLKVTPFATQPGGLVPSGPQAPSAGGTGQTPSAGALAGYQGGWKTFTSGEGGFSFEYPVVYDSPAFNFCAARPGQPPAAAALGARTTVTLAATQLDLPAAVAAYKADPAHQAFQFEPPVERTVGGGPAVTLPYRSGGTGRYAEVTLFIKAGTLYRVDTSGPSACDVPAQGLTELSAYAHALDTFTFK